MSNNPFREDKLLLSNNKEFKVFQTPERITTPLTRVTKKIFLAGTIDMGNSENWQEKVIKKLEEKSKSGWFGTPYHIYNPRRDDWDSSWKQTYEDPQFYQQVNWELDAMEKADYIIMNFLPDSQSPITLLELGLMAKSKKLHVICPDEFWRSGNVQIVCAKYDIPLYKSIDDLLL